MLTLVVYPLMKTSKGLVPGEFEQATVRWADGETVVECPDAELTARLTLIFHTPLRVRRSVGQDPTVVAWEVCELQPHTESFFREVRYHLHRHGLHGRLSGATP